MEQPTSNERPRSAFQRMLDADPELAARVEAIRQELRSAADEELKAVEQSEILTAEDFAIVINTRAEGQ